MAALKVDADDRVVLVDCPERERAFIEECRVPNVSQISWLDTLSDLESELVETAET